MSLSTWVEGEVKELVGPVEFECVPMGMTELSNEDRQASLAFQKQTAELQRVMLAANEVLNDSLERVRYMKAAIERSPKLDLELRKRARELELKLIDLDEQLTGDPTKSKRQEPEMPGLLARLQQVVGGHWATTSAPTTTYRQQYEIVFGKMEAFLGSLRQIVEVEVVELEKQLETVGAPWTPGRSLPSWPPK